MRDIRKTVDSRYGVIWPAPNLRAGQRRIGGETLGAVVFAPDGLYGTRLLGTGNTVSEFKATPAALRTVSRA